MRNCPNHSGQHNNTVRYCLSVNDNRGESSMAGESGEHGFRFYNNTIINCADFEMKNIDNALIANNIIIPAEGFSIDCDADTPFKNITFSNNCYYGCLKPVYDPCSLNCDPGFTSSDTSDINSFLLSKDSPLIGAGIKVDDGLTEDFFGNELDSCNIGCYDGAGTDAEYVREHIPARIIRYIRMVLEYLVREIKALFD